jgi:hypothetical protein
MINETQNGWEIMGEALEKAGGGGTCLLNIPSSQGAAPQVEQLRKTGWNVSLVSNQTEMTRFAMEFARLKYDKPAGVKR